MSRYLTLCSMVLFAFVMHAVAESTANFGTIYEAKAMLQRAVKEMHANEAAAIDKFNFNAQGFRDRDLSVFCFGRHDGKFTAHEALVGADVREFRDAAGRPVGNAMFTLAKDAEITEVGFLSPVPGRIGHAPKLAYVMAIGRHVCGVSAFLFDDHFGADAHTADTLPKQKSRSP